MTIQHCDSVPGPCDRCGAITSAHRSICLECAFPRPQREHPKRCRKCGGWNCGTFYDCNAAAVLTEVTAMAA